MSAPSKAVPAPSIVRSAEPRVSQYDWETLSGDLNGYGCAVLEKRPHYRTGLNWAIWVTSVRMRREDQTSISSHPLADLGGQVNAITCERSRSSLKLVRLEGSTVSKNAPRDARELVANAGIGNAKAFGDTFKSLRGQVLADIGFGRDVNDFTAIATRIAGLGKVDVISTYTTGAMRGPAFFAYANNYLIDVKFGVIMDVEASRAIRQAEVGAAKTMIDRTEERFGLKAERLAADTAYGSGANLNWLVQDKKIAPHIPVGISEEGWPPQDRSGWPNPKPGQHEPFGAAIYCFRCKGREPDKRSAH